MTVLNALCRFGLMRGNRYLRRKLSVYELSRVPLLTKGSVLVMAYFARALQWLRLVVVWTAWLLRVSE